MVNFLAVATKKVGVSSPLLIEPRDLQMAVKGGCYRDATHTQTNFPFFSSSERRNKKIKRERILRTIEQNGPRASDVTGCCFQN